MFYTYILECVNSKTSRKIFYIGSTDNLKSRIIQHRSKNTDTTKAFDIIKLIYYEACLHKTDALKRELQLKTGFGRGYVKRRLENYLKKSAGVVQR